MTTCYIIALTVFNWLYETQLLKKNNSLNIYMRTAKHSPQCRTLLRMWYLNIHEKIFNKEVYCLYHSVTDFREESFCIETQYKRSRLLQTNVEIMPSSVCSQLCGLGILKLYSLSIPEIKIIFKFQGLLKGRQC